ncbi:hypothetical protein ABPG72_017038 [Tetrahymena utriculariae]
MNKYPSIRTDDTEINQRQQEPENITIISQQEKKKNGPFINKVLVIILILCLITLVFTFSFSSKYQVPAKKKKEHKDAYKFMKENIQQNSNQMQNENQIHQKEQIRDNSNDKSSNSPKDIKNFENSNDADSQKNKASSKLDENGKNTNKDEIKQENKSDSVNNLQIKEEQADDYDGETQSKQGNIRGSQSAQKEKDNQKFISSKTVNEDTILWGHYKPHLIYNISQRKKNPLSMSMSYFPNMEINQIYTLYSKKAFENQVFYDFKYNDGTRFSEYLINDKRYDFKVESIFIKQKANKNKQQWVNQHKIFKSTNFTPSRKNKSLIFSISQEIYDIKSVQSEGQFFHFKLEKNENSITVDAFQLKKNNKNLAENKDSSNFLGSFVFTLEKDNQLIQGNELKNLINYSQLFMPNQENNWDIQKAISDNIRYQTRTLNNQETSGQQINNFILLQFNFQQEFEYKIHISYDSSKYGNEQKPPNQYPFDDSLQKLIKQYENQFQQSIESKGVSDNHNCTVFALSNLLGGMTYKYGNLQYTQKEEERRSQPQSIFSFTPSRTRFGWPFLWDDGFHNAVASKFQPKLSAFVIKSWLDSMNEDGWICREQSRGEEAFGLCNCQQFIKKDNRDGNPPTLILAIEYFMREHLDIVKELFNEGYFQKLEKWYHWYLKTQMVKDDQFTGNINNFQDFERNSFVFKFWDIDGKMASMNSGLDDYPRNDNGKPFYEPIGHIDLQSWMYHFTYIMQKFSLLIPDMKKYEYYLSIKEIILIRTEEYFLDHIDSLYKDIISSIRNLRQVEFSPHFGYPNLLPLAFGIVKDDGYQLQTLMKRIQDQNILWTDYGLRSLSKSDTYYQRGNSYWTQPIWIQINYLVLRGLNLYYQENEEATQLYSKLRKNVSNVVCQNWEKTGFFYENYNKYDNGQGSDAYPFTGWTATVALINAENY